MWIVASRWIHVRLRLGQVGAEVHMAQSGTSGLEGVIVADTALSEVDGERGRLIIAGQDVEVLAGRNSFEELAVRLWAAVPGVTSAEALRRAPGGRGVGALAQLPTPAR